VPRTDLWGCASGWVGAGPGGIAAGVHWSTALGVPGPSVSLARVDGTAVTAVVAADRDDSFVGSSPAVRRWERALLQLLTVSWMYTVYEEFRAAATGSMSSAAAHARQIVSIERAIGLDIEHTVQQLTFHLPWLVGLCNVCYGATHLVVPPVALVILYRRAPDRYRQWRNVFLIMLGLSLICFWLFPVLPPRLMPGQHRLVDTSTSYFSVNRIPGSDVVSTTTRSGTPEWAPFTNPMAAMPSLHVGFAIWASLALWPIVRRRGLRWLVALYPLTMIWSVMVTGNHWLLDTAGGALVVGLAWLVTRGAAAIKYRKVGRPVEPAAPRTCPWLDPAASHPIGSRAMRVSAYRRHTVPRPRTTMRISSQANRMEMPAKNRTAAKKTVVRT